jgi:hypothetical protein
MFIIECKVNGKERIYRLPDEAGRKIQAAINADTLPWRITIEDESVRTPDILIVSPEGIWWEKDARGQAMFHRKRCKHCFSVLPIVSACECEDARKEAKAVSGEECLETDAPPLTPERVRKGWVKALREAHSVNPCLFDGNFAAPFMRKHGITKEDVTGTKELCF